jgi:hypothetical protein
MFRYVLRADGSYDRSTDNLPAATKMQMPADWAAAFGGDFLGRVRYIRPFNSPPGLQLDERVWLVVEPQRSRAIVMIVGEALGSVGADGPAERFDITHRLLSHNRLEIIVDHPAADDDGIITVDPAFVDAGGLVGEVRLEIEERR